MNNRIRSLCETIEMASSLGTNLLCGEIVSHNSEYGVARIFFQNWKVFGLYINKYFFLHISNLNDALRGCKITVSAPINGAT